MKKGILFTLAAAIIYGFTPILGYYTYNYGNFPINLTFFRNLFVVPVIFVIMIRKGISFKLSFAMFIKLLFLALFGALMTTVLLYSSYSYIGVGTSTTLHFMFPIFVLVLSKIFYKDKINQTQIVSIILSFFGIIMFVDLRSFTSILGIAFALSSGFTYGVFVLLIEKWKLSSINSYTFSFYISLFISCCMLIFNNYKEILDFRFPVHVYLAMFSVSILASFVGVVFLKEGIDILGSKIVSMLCLAEPISAMAFGVMFLGDSIILLHVLGTLMILCAMLVLAIPETIEKYIHSISLIFK